MGNNSPLANVINQPANRNNNNNNSNNNINNNNQNANTSYLWRKWLLLPTFSTISKQSLNNPSTIPKRSLNDPIPKDPKGSRPIHSLKSRDCNWGGGGVWPICYRAISMKFTVRVLRSTGYNLSVSWSKSVHNYGCWARFRLPAERYRRQRRHNRAKYPTGADRSRCACAGQRPICEL